MNGGHLDAGAYIDLKTIDYFARLRGLRSKVCLEMFNTLDLVCDRSNVSNKQMPQEHTLQWAGVIDTCQSQDDPVVSDFDFSMFVF